MKKIENSINLTGKDVSSKRSQQSRPSSRLYRFTYRLVSSNLCGGFVILHSWTVLPVECAALWGWDCLRDGLPWTGQAAGSEASGRLIHVDVVMNSEGAGELAAHHRVKAWDPAPASTLHSLLLLGNKKSTLNSFSTTSLKPHYHYYIFAFYESFKGIQLRDENGLSCYIM